MKGDKAINVRPA